MPFAFATNHLASNPSPTSPIRSRRSHSIIPSPTLLPGSGQLRQATVSPNARRPLPNTTTASLATPTKAIRPTQHNVTQRGDAIGTANFCSSAASSCSPQDPSPGPVIVAHTAVSTSFLLFLVCHRPCPRTLHEGSTSTYRGIIFIEAGAVGTQSFWASLPPPLSASSARFTTSRRCERCPLQGHLTTRRQGGFQPGSRGIPRCSAKPHILSKRDLCKPYHGPSRIERISVRNPRRPYHRRIQQPRRSCCSSPHHG